MANIRKRFLYEISQMKNDLHIIEYLCWWALRLCMIITYIVFTVKGEALYQRNLILINTVATFAIFLMRFILPKRLFTSKLSYRIQSYIDIFVLLGSFLGHGMKFLGEVPEYDKFMHIMAGGVVVFIGAEVVKAFDGHENLTPALRLFCGIGFSFIFIVLWENMEFIADWLITDSNNQNYLGAPGEYDLFIKIFGESKNSPEQNPVYDTNADMLYAVIGCILFSVPFYFVLSKNYKRLKKEDVIKETVNV